MRKSGCRWAKSLVTLVVAGGLLLTGIPAAAGGEGEPVPVEAAGVVEGHVEQGEGAPAWSLALDTVEPGEVAARAADERVSLAEAERRIRVDSAAAALQATARDRWPSTFAGLWIDTEPFGVTVAFTRDAKANVAALRADFPYPADLVAATRSRSAQDLASVIERLQAARADLKRGERPAAVPPALADTAGAFDLDVDVRANTVVVRVEQVTPELSAQLHGAYGGAVQAKPGMAVPAACNLTDCRWAMLGGIKLNLGTTTGYCSSAFAAFAGSTPYVMSAGHCYADSGITSRYHAGSSYGATDRYGYSGYVDAERERRTNTTFQQSSKFWVAGEDPRMVTSYTGWASVAVGTYLGKSGVRTSTTRGYVTSTNVSPSYVANSSRFISADFCVDSGDSGGAVWRNNSAYGIVSGRFLSGSCYGPSGGPGIFGAIDYAMSSLQVSLLTNTNLAPNAAFTESCTLLMSCTFRDASTDYDGSVRSWSWRFGDGNSSTSRNPSHTYLLPGQYTVTLTVTDNNGASRSISKSVLVL